MNLSVVWLLPEHPTTHYGFMGELYAMLTEQLSAYVACWSVSWNPHWPAGTKGYHMQVWNARGRHVGFWGPWSVRGLARTLESLWQMEGFVPQIVQVNSFSWTHRLAQRWRHRFSAQLSHPFPWIHEDSPIGLPTTGIGTAQTPTSKTITLFTSTDGVEKAAYTAEVFALAGYTVHVVGYPRVATPLRKAAARFPGRIDLALGLSVWEIELYAQASEALVQVGPEEGPLLEWGRPWFCPAGHRLAPWATCTYADPADLPVQLSSLSSAPLASTPEEFTNHLLKVYAFIAKSS